MRREKEAGLVGPLLLLAIGKVRFRCCSEQQKRRESENLVVSTVVSFSS